MNQEELIEVSKGIVSQMYEHMGKLESIKIAKQKILDGRISILMGEGEILDLPELTDNQKDRIKGVITGFLDENVAESVKYLELINAKKAAWENPEFKAAADPLFEEVKTQSKTEEDFEKAKQWAREGKSSSFIAKELGFKTTQSVYNMFNQHKVKFGDFRPVSIEIP